MRNAESNFDLIVVLLCGIFSTIAIFVDFIFNDYLTLNTLPLAIVLFFSVIGFGFLFYRIQIKLMENNEQVVFKKYLIYHFFECKKDLLDFELYCVAENKKEVIHWFKMNCWKISEEKICVLLENQDFNVLGSLILKSSNSKSFCKEAIDYAHFYSAPKFYHFFIKYKNGSLINEKKPILELLLSVISFLISAISIFGFSSLFDISWIVYFCFASPLLYLAIKLLFTYKSRLSDLLNYYSQVYKDLKATYQEFCESKKVV